MYKEWVSVHHDSRVTVVVCARSRSQSPLERVSTNCSEALKNLSSNGDGGIEEGTVATLIQMSLHAHNAAAASALDEDPVLLGLGGADGGALQQLLARDAMPAIAEPRFAPKPALVPDVDGGSDLPEVRDGDDDDDDDASHTR